MRTSAFRLANYFCSAFPYLNCDFFRTPNIMLLSTIRAFKLDGRSWLGRGGRL